MMIVWSTTVQASSVVVQNDGVAIEVSAGSVYLSTGTNGIKLGAVWGEDAAGNHIRTAIGTDAIGGHVEIAYARPFDFNTVPLQARLGFRAYHSGISQQRLFLGFAYSF